MPDPMIRASLQRVPRGMKRINAIDALDDMLKAPSESDSYFSIHSGERCSRDERTNLSKLLRFALIPPPLSSSMSITGKVIILHIEKFPHPALVYFRPQQEHSQSF
jgi:hypothetical protein